MLAMIAALLAMEGNVKQAKGDFTVKMAPAAPGRMTLDKRFTGPLEATGKGEMLTAMTAVEGSAAYVAIEHVEGMLDGRKGGFDLVHRGVMTRGEKALSVSVVPDSGTGELAGIAGTLEIEIDAGGHHYVLDYTLPETR